MTTPSQFVCFLERQCINKAGCYLSEAFVGYVLTGLLVYYKYMYISSFTTWLLVTGNNTVCTMVGNTHVLYMAVVGIEWQGQKMSTSL